MSSLNTWESNHPSGASTLFDRGTHLSLGVMGMLFSVKCKNVPLLPLGSLLGIDFSVLKVSRTTNWLSFLLHKNDRVGLDDLNSFFRALKRKSHDSIMTQTLFRESALGSDMNLKLNERLPFL